MAKAKPNDDPFLAVAEGGRQLDKASAALPVSSPPARPVIGLVAPPQPGLKARQLFQAAKEASLEHVSALQSALVGVETLLADIVEGGEIYAPGLSEFAGRLREELFWKSKTLEALAQTQRQGVEGAPH